MKRKQNGWGFTVVELLIVIVVMSVLAAFTTIAYRGYREKSNATVARSDFVQTFEKIDGYITNSNYPGTISECPTPAATNMCIQPKAGQTFTYYAFNPASPPRFSAALHSTTTPAFELLVRNSDGGFYYGSNAEMSSGNEFLQYMDMAPIIDQYGLRKYKISFDIKSASTANQSTVQAYLQNGSGARYAFYATVPVTTSYVRQSITVTPTGPDTAFTQSVMAFYGTYGTGNRPTVKNLEIGPAF